MDKLLCSSCFRKWCSLLLVLGATVTISADDKLRCGPGITTPGVTVPSGDIILEHGSPLEILCILDANIVSQGFNSSNLVFYHTSFKVQPEFVNIVNESTARLYVEKPVPMKDMFYCKLANGTEESPVCLNSVAVGFKPQEVLNFSCLSQNWDNLTCTWTPPTNYVKTEYSLVFHLPGRAGGRFKYTCPNETDVKGKNYCFWNHYSNPPYRQPYEYYFFVMTGINKFGNVTSKLRFHHYAYVIPAKPVNLAVLGKTQNSVLLQWALQLPIQNFPPGLNQKVEYQSVGEPRDTWHAVNTSSLHKKNETHQLNVTDLEFANNFYEFRVFMRSPVAVGENLWSKPATITVKTKPTIPGAAPRTDIGSFEVTTVGLMSRDVYVYWQRIPEYMYNGDHFGYRVSVYEDGVPRNFQTNTSNAAYSLFRGLSLNSYRFKIISVNEEGTSRDYAEVNVPSQSESIAEPQSFTKIAFDEYTYELSWKAPETNYPISSYTIFWCDNKMDRPYQCTGTLNWTRVSRDVLIKNITVPDDTIYQFAISANSETKSSGMIWATCTVIHNKTLSKMKNIWTNSVGPTYIVVGWKLECSDRIGVVTGFQISYCPIATPHNTTCRVEAKNTIIKAEESTIQGNVTGLKPYTTYMVMVAVMTKDNNVGMASDRQLRTTLEAAPDSPQNVSVSEVTNTSMLVQWEPPVSMNGVLRYYSVYYNTHSLKVEAEQDPNTQVRLVNLKSYTNYNVSVSACTVACSDKSSLVEVLTSIGNPGVIDRPNVKFINSSLLEVDWKPPVYKAGFLDAYQVKVQISGQARNTSEIQNCSDRHLQITIEDCNAGGRHYTYSFSVRAVNYANNLPYYGPWSEAGEGNCFNSGMGKYFFFVMWVVIVLVGISLGLAMVFFGKRLWHWVKVMKEVEVRLPPGLEALHFQGKPDDPIIWNDGWGAQPPENKTLRNPPDQELLLQKKDSLETETEGDGGDYSSLGDGEGDSSGCSSAHESVVSSLTAGTHISSDSGTEADQLNSQRTSSLDEVFTDAGSSLRLRNRTSGSDSSNRWDRGEPYVMLGGGSSSGSCLVKSTPNLNEVQQLAVDGGYSLLGGGVPWRPVPSATGYVSLPPSASLPHPPFKEPSPAPAPGKGYVMAGESEPLPQYCRLGHLDYVPHS